MSNFKENNIAQKKSKLNIISQNQQSEEDIIIKYINELKDEEKRSKALSKLSEYYDKSKNLPIYLWYSQGTMAILLQEIISTYKHFSSTKLSSEKYSKIRNILLLLTSITSHEEIRHKFIESKMPIFLYPFLNSTSTAKQNEYIKLLTLTVITNLIIPQEPETISFFINTQIIPILLKIIDRGPLISKVPACLMIHLIVKADEGLKYICEDKMRYSAIILFMRHMLKNKHNPKIIEQTLKTFLRLAENNDARIILKNTLLKEIKDKNFTKHLNESSKILNNCLLKILNEKDETNKDKDNNNKIINNFNNNEQQYNNINNQSVNSDMMNQYNMNNNMIMMNQPMTQMKQNYMMQNNYSDVNNYNMYSNGNENYLNKMNYIGNQNNNKQFMNMNFYNMYKSS
jgi:CCR4-NOT transcription complex subunit 9